MAPRVAVIGAGPLGLMAMKTLKEDGFDVTGYEARPYVGGLWKYSDDPYISVQEGTIFNSSRYRSAISDFPFKDDVDDYPTWRQMCDYLQDYCDHFGLRELINLNCQVTSLMRKGNQWMLEVIQKGAPPRYDNFDKVCVAIGSFVKPKQPIFEDIEKFGGRQLHTINFHHPEKFDDQNVLIIGLHASAQDVACALQGHAKQVYLSHRNGVLLVSRYSPNGATFDQALTLKFVFFQKFMLIWFPNLFNWLIDKLVKMMSKSAFPDIPKSWKFDDPPSVSVTPPLIADEIYPLMKSGFAEPVNAVRRVVSSKSVELVDGRVLEDIDSIIYCTGYDFAVSFVEKEYNPYPRPGEFPNLYHNTFALHPDPDVCNSLAYMGHGAIAFPGFVQFELVAMAISQAWLGNSPLPSYEEMKSWRTKTLKWRNEMVARQKTQSTFYTAFVPFPDHIQWLNWAAGAGVFEHFSGWFNSRSWVLWWKDYELYKACMNGVFSPSIWRLFDMGKRKPWPKAREQVLIDQERAKRQAEERLEKVKQEESRKNK